MTAKDIISRSTLKRLTTDLARHLLGIEAEAIELLETQNQRLSENRDFKQQVEGNYSAPTGRPNRSPGQRPG